MPVAAASIVSRKILNINDAIDYNPGLYHHILHELINFVINLIDQFVKEI